MVKPTLRYDELQTVISKIELTINSRPIVAMYEDSVEEAITPNHLLFGEKLCTRNTISDEVPEIDLLRRLKYLRNVNPIFGNAGNPNI